MPVVMSEHFREWGGGGKRIHHFLRSSVDTFLGNSLWFGDKKKDRVKLSWPNLLVQYS